MDALPINGALPRNSRRQPRGVKWYKARAEDIPGFVSGQFCYEDVVLTNRLSTCIEPQVPQHPNSIRDLRPSRPVHQAGVRTEQQGERVGRLRDRGECATGYGSVPGAQERLYGKAGATNGASYTLLANPPGFHIRRACYLAAAEPLDLARFFKPKTSTHSARGKENNGQKEVAFPPPGTTVLCCFNHPHPRLHKGFLPCLTEADPTRGEGRALGDYALKYGDIPPCPREEDATNNRRAHMRRLYLKCNSISNDGDPASPLRFTTHRRMVFVQTVLPIRQMLLCPRLGLQQQQFLNIGSSHDYNSGIMQEITMPSAYMYSQPGLGTFANHDLLRGAQYGAQAPGIAANVGS
ncbi:hypothetical protein DL762_006235 [Monosporascus cannonballus]|uniref:Uncharacterized protein n=1 Tax=Monosporascus cannonballus TaxID=155416 RepID=A0ABY0H5Y1_9PEZI|nr:hypothetical protein DL762_006235 [Monosporascus cannonballus]